MNRNKLWYMALAEMKARKRDGEAYRILSAWTYLQMAMKKPANKQTRTPPRVTVGGAS